MKQVKDGLAGIRFNATSGSTSASGNGLANTPITYSFMYVQWEANEIISDELIRNLSLTFGTIALVSLLLIANFQVNKNIPSFDNFNLFLRASRVNFLMHFILKPIFFVVHTK